MTVLGGVWYHSQQGTVEHFLGILKHFTPLAEPSTSEVLKRGAMSQTGNFKYLITFFLARNRTFPSFQQHNRNTPAISQRI